LENKINLDNKSFNRFAIVFTIVITIYLLLRAFFNEFLADETASYWYFAYKGNFYGKNIVLDAANHPLNSLLSHFSYLVFGDIKGLIRIWSVLSYLLYAYFSYQICLQYKRKYLQYLAFVALNSIPYMLEYFAYTRGYGLSMGFFMGSLYWLVRFSKYPDIKSLIYCYIFGLLGFSANLTLLSTLLLTFSFAFFIQLAFWKNIQQKTNIRLIILHVLLIISIVPFVQFSFRLKEAGALYYSSLDGLWDMTGKSLSQYVLFYDKTPLMYVFIFIFLLFVYFLCRLLIQNGWRKFIQLDNTIVAFLFFGNLCLSLLLALLLKINYPSDRTGMYLIPLFLILLFYILEKVRYSEWLLLFFPLSLVFHLSIHTSIFSPDDRLSQHYFDAVYKNIQKDDAIVIYKTMFANWLYMSSHKKHKYSIGQVHMEKTKYADIFLTKVDRQEDTLFRNPNLNLYKLIAKDEDANMLAYRRIHPAKRTLVFKKEIKYAAINSEFFELLNDSQLKSITVAKNLIVSVKGHLKLQKGNGTDLVLTTSDINDNLVRYLTNVFELSYQNQAMDDDFQINFLLEHIKTEEVKLKIYFWNKEKNFWQYMKNAEVKIFEIQ
jgi:hypothetical protein